MGPREHVVSEPSRLYHRELPGGGYVAIELVYEPVVAAGIIEQRLERRMDEERREGHEPPAVAVLDGRPCRGRVAVERRAPGERRATGDVPVIAEVERDDVNEVFNELYQIASDNVAVARGLLHWQAARRQVD